MHVYEARPRKDKRGVDLISNELPFGRLWYVEPNAISNAIDYAKARRLILRENSRPLSLVVFGMSDGLLA